MGLQGAAPRVQLRLACPAAARRRQLGPRCRLGGWAGFCELGIAGQVGEADRATNGPTDVLVSQLLKQQYLLLDRLELPAKVG